MSKIEKLPTYEEIQATYNKVVEMLAQLDKLKTRGEELAIEFEENYKSAQALSVEIKNTLSNNPFSGLFSKFREVVKDNPAFLPR